MLGSKTFYVGPIDHLVKDQVDVSEEDITRIKDNLIAKLSEQSSAVPMTDSMPVALDWINGRRTPDANQALKAAIMNLNLGTKAPEIFRALVEAICFGSKNDRR